jgi:hypothetical protein
MKKIVIKKKVLIPVIILLFLALSVLLYTPIATTIADSQVHYAQPVGELHIGNDSGQQLAIVDYTEKHLNAIEDLSHAQSSATVYGYDSTYIYASVIFRYQAGDDSSRPLPEGVDYTRFTYEGSSYAPTITDSISQGDDNHNPSLESIFPRVIDKMTFKQ